jgi:hypothetical protein
MVASTPNDLDVVRGSPVFRNHSYVILGLEQTEAGTQVRMANLHRQRAPSPDSFYKHLYLRTVAIPDEVDAAENEKAIGEFTVSLAELARLFVQIDWVDLAG